jgi:hypothetical protein
MKLTFIQQKIYDIRGQRVLLDFDLSELYQVETKRLNQQVKRNIDRFPEEFMFRLTKVEWDGMRSQFVTSSTNVISMLSQIATASQKKRNILATPFAFTELCKALHNLLVYINRTWCYHVIQCFEFGQGDRNEYCHI